MEYKGKKTYIAMVATICYALGGAVAGFHGWEVAVPLVLGALGLSGLRHALTPETPKVEEIPVRV